MKKKSIVLITIAIIGLGAYFTYYSEANKGNDSIVTDKNGEVVEPLNQDEDNDNLGHWCKVSFTIDIDHKENKTKKKAGSRLFFIVFFSFCNQ